MKMVENSLMLLVSFKATINEISTLPTILKLGEKDRSKERGKRRN